MGDARILLTNDDGVDAPGLEAVHEELSAHFDVTVVAPQENRSGDGKQRTGRARVVDHPKGYALAGTPADCVAFGLRGLEATFDLVVSGCNHGPNIGSYVLCASGTVGAAMEAGFLGTPAVAVSAYDHASFFPHPPEEFDFGPAARVTRDVVGRALERDPFDDVDVLNLNVPERDDVEMRRTHPRADYDAGAVRDGDVVEFENQYWATVGRDGEPLPELRAHRDAYDTRSERRALLDGVVALSPLLAPHSVDGDPVVDDVVEAHNRSRDGPDDPAGGR